MNKCNLASLMSDEDGASLRHVRTFQIKRDTVCSFLMISGKATDHR